MRKVRTCVIVAGLAVVLLVSATQAGFVRVDTVGIDVREPVVSGRSPSVERTAPGDCITQIDCMTLSLKGGTDGDNAIGRAGATVPVPVAFALMAVGAVGLIPRRRHS